MVLPLIGVLLTGCGKRLPPLPPIERVQQRTESLSGVQRGNTVILSWPAPLRNAPSSSVQSIRRIDVYRLQQSPNAPLALTEEEFALRSTLVGSVTYDEIQKAVGQITYQDTLELAGEPTRLRYAVRFVNAAGQRAAFSNFLLIEPAARIANPPVVTSTENDFTETAVQIKWQQPTKNIDDSTPVNLLGFNVFRIDQSQSEASATLLNKTPVNGNQFDDTTFQFGETYRYFVRAVSLGTGGLPVESVNSNIVTIQPRDIFPPAAPEAPRIGPGRPGQLSLFIVPNKEPDVAGYNIFRSEDPNRPKPWDKLNTTLFTRNTFLDDKVVSGKTYYYYVVAVDKAGNISKDGAVASETAP